MTLLIVLAVVVILALLFIRFAYWLIDRLIEGEGR